MNVLFQKSLWKKFSKHALTIWYIGPINCHSVITIILNNRDWGVLLGGYLKELRGSFAIVVQRGTDVFAAVDRINSYPLYYSNSNIYDSYQPSMMPLGTRDSFVLNYLASGYIFGNGTLADNIKQLLAGQYLYLSDHNIQIQNYYLYSPRYNDTYDSNEHKIEALHALTNQAMDRAIAQANGRKILVPLSGGYDSRLILAKLVEKKYDNLFVFTYGMPNSHEAKMAEWVCGQLNIKWDFLSFRNVDINSEDYKTLYQAYLSYCPLHSSMPCVLEFIAFYAISKLFSDEPCFVINGQTGDFITGGHINLKNMNYQSRSGVIQYILNKHCAYWPALLESGYSKVLYTLAEESFPKRAAKDGISQLSDVCLSQYEQWEWQERQSKYVVSGQRLYDFFGYDWALPLWDADIMNFWEISSLRDKSSQKLYRDYLKDYNYKNVFSLDRLPASLWTRQYKSIQLVAKVIHLLAGRERKNTFYKYMDYYSTYHHQYCMLGRDFYKKYWKSIRNPGSLLSLSILQKLNIDVSHYVDTTAHNVF